MSNKLQITVNGDAEVIALLDKLPKLLVLSGGPADRAMKAATTVLQDRAIAIAPDSRSTGSRKKQSKKSKAIWKGKLNQKIRKKLIRHQSGVYGLVGPKSPEGNMANFVSGKQRRLVLWGKSTRVVVYRYQRNWMLQAFDESRDQQLTAMRRTLKTELDQQWRGSHK
jgi:ribosomal protein L18